MKTIINKFLQVLEIVFMIGIWNYFHKPKEDDDSDSFEKGNFYFFNNYIITKISVVELCFLNLNTYIFRLLQSIQYLLLTLLLFKLKILFIRFFLL